LKSDGIKPTPEDRVFVLQNNTCILGSLGVLSMTSFRCSFSSLTIIEIVEDQINSASRIIILDLVGNTRPSVTTIFQIGHEGVRIGQ
jgi:hypothetical protein